MAASYNQWSFRPDPASLANVTPTTFTPVTSGTLAPSSLTFLIGSTGLANPIYAFHIYFAVAFRHVTPLDLSNPTLPDGYLRLLLVRSNTTTASSTKLSDYLWDSQFLPPSQSITSLTSPYTSQYTPPSASSPGVVLLDKIFRFHSVEMYKSARFPPPVDPATYPYADGFSTVFGDDPATYQFSLQPPTYPTSCPTHLPTSGDYAYFLLWYPSNGDPCPYTADLSFFAWVSDRY